MKLTEKNKAISLRKKGNSIGEIAHTLGVSKGSVSIWVREISLTSRQRKKLNKNGHSVAAIEKRRIARLKNTYLKRQKIMEDAERDVVNLLKDPLWCIGVSLYWGEGGKTQYTARISNSDPRVIQTMMNFFQQCCHIPKEKFRAHIHTFSHTNEREALEYWSEISGIPSNKFFKTYIKQSGASLKKRHTLPYGTVQIYILDTNFFLKLMGWIQGLTNLYAKST